MEVEKSVGASSAEKGGDGTINIRERKAIVARRYITKNAPKIKALAEAIRSADKSTFTDYEKVVGPVSAD